MAVYKLLDDFEEDNEFILIAVHSSMEDYRLAFFLNKYLGTRFVKVHPIEIASNKVFQNYEWMDKKNDVCWNVIQNIAEVETKKKNDSGLLFDGLNGTEFAYLLPEHKKVDYFIKINTKEDFWDIQKTIQNIQQVPNIISTYKLAANKIKTTTNLIF